MAVRRESVQIHAESNLTSVLTRDAAAAALLRRELDSINGHPFFQANSRGQVVRIDHQFTQATQSASRFQRQTDQASGSINQLTGRLGLFADAALILGPGLIPIAAVGAQAIGGLAVATTAATTAGLAAVVAFQGVGDAVKAADAYAIEPSAQNLDKLQVAMKAIGPEAQQFVRHFQAFKPLLNEIRDSAAAGLFPGLTESLSNFERMGPRVSHLLGVVSTELGSIAADSSESFSGPRWAGFLGYLRDEMPDALRILSQTMGDLTHGAATLMQRLDPGNDRFLAWVKDVADGFDDWASSAGGRDDIRAFLEYAKESGPEVAQLFTSLVGALAAIVTAAAPLGGPVLTGLTAISDMIKSIAESDAATPLLAAYAAFRLYARGAGLAAAAQVRFNSTQRAAAAANGGAAGAAAVTAAGLSGTPLGAALTAPRPQDVAAARRAQRMARFNLGAQGAAVAGMIAMTATPLGDLTEQAGASNAAMGALLGTMVAPGWGTAAGAIAGAAIDMASANDELTQSLDAADRALGDSDLTAAAQNLSKAREELAKYRKEQDIGKSDLPSFGAGLQNVKDDFQVMFGGKSDGDAAEERIRQLEDLYHAQYKLSQLKPVSNYDGLNDLFGDLNGVITPTTNALNDFVDAMRSADEFLSYRGNLRDYEAAWDNIRDSIKENGKTLDATTEKGRANGEALDGFAEKGKTFAESLTGYKRTTFLKKLSEDVRDAANQFDMGKGKVDAYLEELGLLNEKTVKPKVDLDDGKISSKTRKAAAKLDALAKKNPSPFADLYTSPLDKKVGAATDKLNKLDKQKPRPAADLHKAQFDSALSRARSDLDRFNGAHATAYINVKVSAPKMAQIEAKFPAGTSADGSTVPKTGLPYADRHPYWLADGEEVISNRHGQADRNRPLLKAINAGYLAEGGTTGNPFPRITAAGLKGMSLASLNAEFRENARALKEFRANLKASTSALEKERQKREDFTSYRSEVSSSLSGELTGNGLAGFDAGVSANKNDARSALYALRKAKKRGLDGPLFDLVASSGDINLIKQFGDLNSRQIAQREYQYGASRSAQNALGNFASQEKFDTTLGGINKTIKSLDRSTRKLGKQVEIGAERGTRLGAERKRRRTSTGTRAGR